MTNAVSLDASVDVEALEPHLAGFRAMEQVTGAAILQLSEQDALSFAAGMLSGTVVCIRELTSLEFTQRALEAAHRSIAEREALRKGPMQ